MGYTRQKKGHGNWPHLLSEVVLLDPEIAETPQKSH
jgi:hypothetical protein